MALTTGSGRRTRVAVHEAGHALAAHMCGARVTFVSVERHAGTLGHCLHEPVGHAGVAAAIAAGGLAAEIEMWGSYDQETAALDLDALRRHAGKDDALVITTVRQRLRRHHDALVLIAGALDREGSLSGERVHAICRCAGVPVLWRVRRRQPPPRRNQVAEEYRDRILRHHLFGFSPIYA